MGHVPINVNEVCNMHKEHVMNKELEELRKEVLYIIKKESRDSMPANPYSKLADIKKLCEFKY